MARKLKFVALVARKDYTYSRLIIGGNAHLANLSNDEATRRLRNSKIIKTWEYVIDIDLSTPSTKAIADRAYVFGKRMAERIAKK